MRDAVLPSDEDRKQVLGQAKSLPSRLLRLLTNPSIPSLRDSISLLLFEMSERDAEIFVQNVGYGFASGFLFQQNIPVPENALEAWSTSEIEGNVASDGNFMSQQSRASKEARKSLIGRDVNPITGQRREFETKIEESEMTEEEKQSEAEKLFVLFERLKKTGVMSVKNLVETAFQEGRVLELDDDAESE